MDICILVGLFVAAFILKCVKKCSITPDPWENEISRDEVNKLKSEVCLRCCAEVKAGQYYCSKCNNATGKYVPYLPFINIPFNYSMHWTLWSKLKSKDHSLVYKAVAVLFIACTAPLMIIVYCLNCVGEWNKSPLAVH